MPHSPRPIAIKHGRHDCFQPHTNISTHANAPTLAVFPNVDIPIVDKDRIAGVSSISVIARVRRERHDNVNVIGKNSVEQLDTPVITYASVRFVRSCAHLRITLPVITWRSKSPRHIVMRERKRIGAVAAEPSATTDHTNGCNFGLAPAEGEGNNFDTDSHNLV